LPQANRLNIEEGNDFGDGVFSKMAAEIGEIISQGLKPLVFSALFGTTKVVP